MEEKGRREEGMAYCDEDKRIALLTLQTCKGNLSRTAIMCREFYDIDVTVETIRQWAKGNGIHERVQEKLKEDRRELSDKLENIAHKMIDAAQTSDTDRLTPAQLMTAAAIAIDKMLLLRGESTTISERKLSEEEIALRIAELRAKLLLSPTTESGHEPETLSAEFLPEEEENR